MKQETWYGESLDVNVVDDPHFDRMELVCKYCVFHERDDCSAIGCVPCERADGKYVFFTRRVSEVPAYNPTTETIKQWKTVAEEQERNSKYYQSVLDQIGDMLGIAAYTADDGVVHDRVLRAKVPELVAKMLYENATLKSRINTLEVLDL